MSGRAILVIRPDDDFSRLLRKSGFEVINLELIKTEPVDDRTELTDAIRQIDGYDGIFLTSPVAAKIFTRRLAEADVHPMARVYVLGERSREALAGAGLNIRFCKTANNAGELISSFGDDEFAGKRFLFLRGDQSVGTIPKMLAGKATVDELVVYRTIENIPDRAVIDNIATRLEKGEIAWVCFFSPSGVKSLVSVVSNLDLSEVEGAAIGETTAAAARDAGLKIDFISQRAIAENFAAGLAAYIKKH